MLPRRIAPALERMSRAKPKGPSRKIAPSAERSTSLPAWMRAVASKPESVPGVKPSTLRALPERMVTLPCGASRANWPPVAKMWTE